MKTGAWRRALTTRSSRPLPRIGSVLAVQVTMMSKRCSASGISFSVIASASKRSASWRPFSSVRLAMVIDFGLPRGEMRRRELDHLAGADEQQALVGDRREDPLGELDRRRRHRDRRAADVGLRAHVLGHREGALEQAVEHQPERAGRLRVPDRLLHLAQDLRLAQHHRIEAARHPERVRDRLLPRQRVDVGRQRIPRHVVELLQPLDDRLRLGPVHVDLGPVAGRQDRGFLDLRSRQQVAQRVPDRVRRERDALPHVQRCGLVVEAEGVESHGLPLAWTRILAQTP